MSDDSLLKQVVSEKEKAEKGWHKDSEEIVRQYEIEAAEEKASGSRDPYYNVLFANTEILLGASFSSLPVPIVKPRRVTPDPVATAVGLLCEQLLTYQIDPNNADKPSFFCSVESTVLDALLPGCGTAQVRYDATFGEAQPVLDPMTGQPMLDPASGEPMMGPPPLESECCYVKHLAWNRVWWGPAKKWEDVPWVAYGYDLSWSEVKKRYAKRRAVLKRLEERLEKSDSKKVKDGQILLIAQVWNKSDGTVGEFCCDFEDEWLQEPEEAPYKITGFYPSPKPLQYVRKTNTLRPTALYRYYQKQAEELDALTMRLRKIINAIKVRGVHSGLIPELGNLFAEGLENTFVKAENPQLMMENGSLDKHIWVWPLEKLIVVAQSLYQQREQCKQVIYEMIGLGDIMRNSSKASESATAQQLKDKWGGLRLQRFQGAVQTYIRDLLRIMLEITAQRFDDSTLEAIMGAPIEPPVLEMFRNFDTRRYGVDVETDSTVAVDDTKDKQDVAEFVMGMGQLAPMLQMLGQAGPTGVEAGKQILLAAVKRFRFGRQVEKAISSIQYQPPPQEAPEAPAAEPQGPTPEELQLKSQELELKKYEIDADNATRVKVAEIQAGSRIQGTVLQNQGRLQLEAAKPPPPPPAAGLPSRSRPR